MAKKEPRHDFNKAVCQWGLSALIGVATAGIAAGITLATRNLLEAKFEAVYHLIRTSSTSFPWLAFAVYTSINMGLALFAGALVAYVEPVAAGSGISEIKSVLNGVKLPRVMRAKTLACKAVGVVASVGGSLPCGKEGPMIHSGAIAAAGISQGKSTTMGLDTAWLREQLIDFRNDQEKRDFVSCGASAGVAAAFGAPVGGVLFSLEEGSSFWSQELTWRAMFTAVVSSYTLNLILSGFVPGQRFGLLTEQGVFTFGKFEGTLQAQAWRVEEIILFIAMGAFGGVIGAGFNALNVAITKWRMAFVSAPHSRLIEVLGVSLLVSLVTFLVPFAGQCKDTPPAIGEEKTVVGEAGPPGTPSADYAFGSVDSADNFAADQSLGMLVGNSTGGLTPQPDTVIEALVRFNCPKGQFNDLATMLLTPSEKAIRALFHALEGNVFESWWRLLIAFVAYSSLTCITYGIAVPSGLFIPSLLAGSYFGRLVALLLNHALSDDPAGNPVLDEGTYSLIGAAAFLGGCVRMTISLAAILMESTGDVQYVLPIIVTLLVARVTGNLLNGGIYDEHIELRRWPLLEESIGRHFHRLKVFDVMTSPVVTVTEVTRVRALLDVIAETQHHGFPVLFTPSRMAKYPRLGTMAGMINRHHIAQILFHRAFHGRPPADIVQDGFEVHLPGGDTALSPRVQMLHARIPSGGTGHPGEQKPTGLVAQQSVSIAALDANRDTGASLARGKATTGSTASSIVDMQDITTGSPGGTVGKALPLAVRRSLEEQGRHDSSGSINSGPDELGSAPDGGSLPGSVPGGPAGSISLMRQHTGLSAVEDGGDPFTNIPAAVAEEPLTGSSDSGEEEKKEQDLVTSGSDGNRQLMGLAQDDGGPGSQAAQLSIDASRDIGAAQGRSAQAGHSSGGAASMNILPTLHPQGVPRRRAGSTRPRSHSRGATSSVSLAPGAAGQADAWERARLGVALKRTDGKKRARKRSGSSVQSGGAAAASVDRTRGRSGSGSRRAARLAIDSSEAIDLRGHGRSTSQGAPRSGAPEWTSETAVSAGTGDTGPSREASQIMESPLESRDGVGRAGGPTGPTVRPKAASGASSGEVHASARGARAGSASRAAGGSRPKLQGIGSKQLRQDRRKVLLEGFDFEGRPLLSWHDIEGPYPRFPQAKDLAKTLTSEDLKQFADLRPYMNATPYTIHVRAPITRAYKLFRSIGLRHLVVVNDCGDAVGMLTRKDLTHTHLHKCYHRKEEREAAMEEQRSEDGESDASGL